MTLPFLLQGLDVAPTGVAAANSYLDEAMPQGTRGWAEVREADFFSPSLAAGDCRPPAASCRFDL